MKNKEFNSVGINPVIRIFLMVFVWWSCDAAKEKVNPNVYYTCSMDPQVMEYKPGNCPICKMPLTKVSRNAIKDETGLRLSEQQISLGNIKTAVVKVHEIGDEIRLTGTLSIDPSKQQSISSRVMGRITRLYKKEVGETIEVGEVLYEIYSEDLNLAVQEYKLGWEKKKTTHLNTLDIDKIIQSARNRLILYGLSETQINSIANSQVMEEVFPIYSNVGGVISAVDIKEGNYVMEGGSIVQVSDYSSLWAEAQVFSQDVSNIREGMKAELSFPGMPEKRVEGSISFVYPEFKPGSQINLVRVEVPNSDYRLKVGMQVDFVVLMNTCRVLAIPTEAIILEAKGASVWVKKGNKRFENRMIHVGLETIDYTEILHGLQVGDTLVVSGAYLLHSEFQFKKGANPMEGHNMEGMK